MQDTEIPYGYVYRIINRVNGKTYIGQRKLCKDRSWRHYMGSGKLIIQAIEKYGKKNFIKVLLDYAYSRDSLNSTERDYILKEVDLNGSEYNLAVFTPSPEPWINLSSEQLDFVKRRISETKKEWLRNNPNPSHVAGEKRYLEFCEKYSQKTLTLYRDMKSAEKVASKLKVSVNHVVRLLKENNIERNHRNIKGVKHSKETLIKISESHKAKIHDDEYIKSHQILCGFCKEYFLSRRLDRITCSPECLKQNKMKNKIRSSLLTKDELYGLYWNENLSKQSIANKLGVHRNTIGNLLVDYGIPTKDIGRKIKKL